MASKSGPEKKSGSTRSRDARYKDLIAELKNRVSILENELRLKRDQTVLDTTECERAIERLAEKERFLSNVFECIQDGVSVLDKDLNIIQVNPAMEKWYGEHITGKKCYQAYHGRSEPCKPCPSIRAIKTGSQQTEIVHDIKGWREIYAFPMVNDRGEVTGVIEHVRDINERKQVEEALRKSEERYRHVVETANEGIWTVDRDTRTTFVNDRMSSMLGYTKEEMIGKKIEDFFSGPDLSLVRPDLVRHLHGAPVRHDSRFRRKDGSHLWCMVSASPIMDDKGDFAGGVAMITDISKRKQAEEALEKSESDLKRAQAIAHLGNWEWDLRTNQLSGSQEYYRMFGFDCQKPVPFEKFASMLHPDDRKWVDEAIKNIHYSDLPHSSDFRLLLPDSSVKFIHSDVEATYDSNGRPVKIFGTMQDITERKHAEEALRESEEKYRFLVENSKDIIWKIDLQGRWTFVSSNVESVNGYRPEEMVGRPVWDFIAPECHESIREKMLKRMRGEDLAPYTTWSINKDGHRTPLEVVTTSIIDESGRIVGVQGISRDITERKRAEEALQESERRYRGIVEDQAELIALLDIDGTITFVNDAYCRYFGKTREELVGHRFLALVSEEDRDAVSASIAGLSRRNPAASIEQRVKRPDGSLAWTDWKNRIVYDDSGRPTGYQSVGRDITERKRAEDAARLANAYNRSLIEASLDPLVTISPDGKVTDVNKATEMATGISRDKLIGTDFSDYFTDPAMARKGYRKVFEEGSVKDYPLELRHRDGCITPVLYNAVVYRDDSGNIIGVFAAARDVTERKRAEDALRESEKKFRVLAETSPAAIFLYQGEKYVYVNPMAQTLTGYSRDELLTGDAWEWIHPEFLELVKDRARRRQRGEELPSHYEVKYRTRDGREGWVDFTAGLIKYGGKPAGLAMAFDVTKRKQAEEALKETKAQAELYVDLMGHDINNMNQVSMGFLELAHNIIEMDGKLGEDNIVLLDKAMNSLNNSSQLIDNVRKLQREKMGLYTPEVIDVDDMVEEAIKQFRSIPGRDVKIVFTPQTHCRVRANSLLKDVFINLVGNAVKHSRGALTVNINVDQVMDNGIKYCHVAVEDDGPGIPDGLKTTLFDRLNLTTTRARGKGFGLCLIKMLVDDYHGRFWVEDRVPGDHTQGAKFVVMLPTVEK